MKCSDWDWLEPFLWSCWLFGSSAGCEELQVEKLSGARQLSPGLRNGLPDARSASHAMLGITQTIHEYREEESGIVPNLPQTYHRVKWYVSDYRK